MTFPGIFSLVNELKCIQNSDDRELSSFALIAVNLLFNILTVGVDTGTRMKVAN